MAKRLGFRFKDIHGFLDSLLGLYACQAGVFARERDHGGHEQCLAGDSCDG